MKKLYLDMDGVLVNFDKWWDPIDATMSTEEEKRAHMEHLISTTNAFEVLEPSEHLSFFRIFVSSLQDRGVECHILSSCGNLQPYERIRDQKNVWIEQHFNVIPEESRIYVTTRGEKKKYADEHSLLIDDCDHICKRFVEYGGYSFQYHHNKHNERIPQLYPRVYTWLNHKNHSVRSRLYA